MTRRGARLCEAAAHFDPRLIPNGFDLYELRAELRRPADGSRAKTMTLIHVCTACGYRLFEDEPALLQATLVGLEPGR